MERVIERVNVARRALATLQELPLDSEPSDIERDAAIQRFEYTVEAVWKAAQVFLREFEGVTIASPKGATRASFQTRLIAEDDARIAMQMIDDRNLTVHMYNEDLARQIYSRLATYASLMERWLAAMARASGM